MPKLVFINKNFEEQEYELMVEKTTVGRGNHNTLVICDPSVSVTHCEILMNGAEIIVRDLGSSNGTFVDGMRLHKGQSQAKSRQVIRFGLVEARLEVEPQAFDEHSTSITAVVEMENYQREKRREEKRLKPASPDGKVEPSAEVQIEGHTVLVPRPPQPSGPLPPPTGETEVTGKSKKWLVVAVVVVIGLAALVWFLLKK